MSAVDAEGKRKLNEAENVLSPEIIALRIKTAVIDNIEGIVREAAKPMERIEGIRIYQVEGLGGGGGANHHAANGEGQAASGNLADHVVNSALRYRSQAPLVDSLLKEIGLSGADIHGLTAAAAGAAGAASPTQTPPPKQAGPASTAKSPSPSPDKAG